METCLVCVLTWGAQGSAGWAPPGVGPAPRGEGAAGLAVLRPRRQAGGGRSVPLLLPATPPVAHRKLGPALGFGMPAPPGPQKTSSHPTSLYWRRNNPWPPPASRSAPSFCLQEQGPYRHGPGALERGSDLPKVTQLGRGRKEHFNFSPPSETDFRFRRRCTGCR